MLFRQRVLIDWVLLKEQRKAQATTNNAKENKKRVDHTYKVEDLVLICQKSYERAKGPKIAPYTHGPYNFVKVYTNGNVRISRGGFEEDIFIRRLRPYFIR